MIGCCFLVLCICFREVVVSVLRRHGESNASVAEQGLEAIRNLAANAGNNTKLGACDACAGLWWWVLIIVFVSWLCCIFCMGSIRSLRSFDVLCHKHDDLSRAELGSFDGIGAFFALCI